MSMSGTTVRASRGLFERALLALPVGENARVFLGVCTVVGVAGAFTASSTLLASAVRPRTALPMLSPPPSLDRAWGGVRLDG